MKRLQYWVLRIIYSVLAVFLSFWPFWIPAVFVMASSAGILGRWAALVGVMGLLTALIFSVMRNSGFTRVVTWGVNAVLGWLRRYVERLQREISENR